MISFKISLTIKILEYVLYKYISTKYTVYVHTYERCG